MAGGQSFRSPSIVMPESTARRRKGGVLRYAACPSGYCGTPDSGHPENGQVVGRHQTLVLQTPGRIGLAMIQHVKGTPLGFLLTREGARRVAGE